MDKTRWPLAASRGGFGIRQTFHTTPTGPKNKCDPTRSPGVTDDPAVVAAIDGRRVALRSRSICDAVSPCHMLRGNCQETPNASKLGAIARTEPSKAVRCGTKIACRCLASSPRRNCCRQCDCERIRGLGRRASRQQWLISTPWRFAQSFRARHSVNLRARAAARASDPDAASPDRRPCQVRASGMHEVSQRPEFESVVGKHDCLGGTEKECWPAVELPAAVPQRQDTFEDAAPSLTCGLLHQGAISFLNASGS
jgi:hypothetical protein